MASSTINPAVTRQVPAADRLRRIEALSAQAIAADPKLSECDPELLFEVCESLDVVVEFAALEGPAMGAALAQYFEDAEPTTTRWGRAQAALREVCNPARVGASTPPQLPVLPSAALKLLKIKEEYATVGQLEAIASSDPVLAARLLGTANSAKFGSRFQISRLQDAIQRIGIPEARKTLIAACFWGLFSSRPLQELWEHSQLVADLACELARRVGLDSAIAYSAGLLHDIGRLIFVRGSARDLALEGSWMSSGFPLVYSEALVRGMDHAVRGAELLESWQLPQDLVDAVRLHHRPEASGSGVTMAHVLFLAEDIASILSERTPEDLWSPMRRQVSLDAIGISEEAFLETLTGFCSDTLRRAG